MRDAPGFDDLTESRKLSTNSSFSWSALVRRMGTAGPMGNLCQVVVVVSRQKIEKDSGGNVVLPNLQSVNCTVSDPDARTLTVSGSVPNGGYIIDETTGTAYIIVSRNEGPPVTVVTLSTPPNNADIGGSRDFWVIPGTNNSPKSPSIRVFQALLYLP